MKSSPAILLLAAIAAIFALRASYAVTMPIAFAALIVAAVWPLKHRLDRWLPSWLSYTATILLLLALFVGFAAAVYLSLGQVIAVISARWPAIQAVYGSVVSWAAARGMTIGPALDPQRIVAMLRLLASGVYQFTTYTGFVALLVALGLPEVHRVRARLSDDLTARDRADVFAGIAAISAQTRRYLGTTLATSILTGVASALWSLVTGLDLAIVWGLLNFLLNFVPVIGNIIGIIPPALYAIVQFGGVGMPLLVFAGFVVLQVTISNVVYPLLQGRELSLSPLVIIVAMTFWSWLWGIAGALIAVPLTAAAVIVCGHFERTRWVRTVLST